MDPNVQLKPPSVPPLTSPQDLKEYVRTFAQDMDTFKKGGAPELHPLEKNPVEKKVEAVLPTRAPEPAKPTPAPTPAQPLPPPTPVDLPAPVVTKVASSTAGVSLQQASDQALAEPKKYIRTFAGDMETLKSGGAPDLKEFAKKVEAPALVAEKPTEPYVPPMPVDVPTPTVPTQVSSPLPPPAPQPKPLFVPRPRPEPVVPPSPQPAQEQKPTPLETYSSDFLSRVKEQRASTAAVLAAEQDAKQGKPKFEAPSTSNMVPIIAGGILLLLGGGGAYVVYTHYQAAPVTIALPQVVTTPISVDDRQKIAGGTSTSLRTAFAQSVARTLAPNAVRLVYTDAATTTGNSVFSQMRFSAPDVLLRNIIANRSMAGVVNTGEAQSAFFILGVTSYSDTFAGMLAWESSMMSDMNDLYPALQPTEVLPTIATTTVIVKPATKTRKAVTRIATTTVVTPVAVFTPAFHDEMIASHDARVYRDAENRVVLVYGYWNRSTLVIARDQTAFAELLDRLANTRP